jgi:hypothetical protein
MVLRPGMLGTYEEVCVLRGEQVCPAQDLDFGAAAGWFGFSACMRHPLLLAPTIQRAENAKEVWYW